MRPCGGCNLCCKLESVDEIQKSKGQLCRFNDADHMCSIYADRPHTCTSFECLWRQDNSLPDSCRPDRAHLYAARVTEEVYKVVCDPNYPHVSETGQQVIRHVADLGFHALVMTHNNIKLEQGRGKDRPQRIILDWTL